MTMIELEDLLFEIFEELRQYRVPLGLSDYLSAVKTMHELTHLEDLENIKSLCRLFWAKSNEDQQLFDETFDIKLNQHFTVINEEIEQNTLPSRMKPPPRPKVNTVSTKPLLLKKEDQQHKPQPSPQRISTTHAQTSRRALSIRHHLIPRAPMEKREMASIWRKLRRPRMEGLLEDLDVQATTETLVKTGFLLEPVLQSRRRNQARLVLLVDQGGSMAPFSLLTQALLESVLHSGSLKYISIFYFHDNPERYLYGYSTLLGARPLDEVLIEYCQGSSVLIVSDAGAARGHYDSTRARATKAFLEKLSHHTYLYAWLNPMPQARWTSTTAWSIAQLLPMFQLDEEGLNDVVNLLRGQSFTGVQRS
jgi:uncharacterized protein with von Willebrand factor type A (vWA) domain